MTDVERIEQRLSAVERVVVDGDVTVEELSELSALTESVAKLEERLEAQERRIATLEASVQSIEGYVGHVESVNDDVERHAAAAIATADRLERRLDALEVEFDDLQGGILVRDAMAAEDGSNGDSRPPSGRPANAESVESDGPSDSGSGTAFEFGTHTRAAPASDRAWTESRADGESVDDGPTPERSVAVLFESDRETATRSATDADGTADTSTRNGDRPASTLEENAADRTVPADQRAVAAAVGGGDSGSTEPDGSADTSGLLGSLRSRLS